MLDEFAAMDVEGDGAEDSGQEQLLGGAPQGAGASLDDS